MHISSCSKAYSDLVPAKVLQQLEPHSKDLYDLATYITQNDLRQPIGLLKSVGNVTNLVVSELLERSEELHDEATTTSVLVSAVVKHIDNALPPSMSVAVNELAKHLRHNHDFHTAVPSLCDPYGIIRDIGVGPTALFAHRLQMALHTLATIGRIPFKRPTKAPQTDATKVGVVPDSHVSSGTGVEGSTSTVSGSLVPYLSQYVTGQLSTFIDVDER